MISISLSAPSSCADVQNLSLHIAPTATGAISTCPQTITVDTNTPGFQLYARADNTNLAHASIPAASPVSSPFGSTYTALSASNWGFGVPSNGDVDGVPSGLITSTLTATTKLESQPLASHQTEKFQSLATSDPGTLLKDYSDPDLTANNNSTTLVYGAAAGLTQTAGQYSVGITYTAIGEPIPEPVYNLSQIATKNNITTMQQLTPTLCASATYDQTNNGPNANNTITLTDTRNSQQYNVRKLADNKCWQIDNMKLAGVTLTSADSNVTTNFVLPPNLITSTVTHGNGRCDSGGTLANGSGYLTCDGTDTRIATDLGFAAIVDPSANSYCAGSSTDANGNYIGDYGSLTNCGYLYNWYTATAGTGTYDQGTNGNQVSGSICPANWRLPAAASTATGPGNGTSYDYADFAVLNASMNANTYTVPGATTSSYYAGWRPGGSFAGVFSGYWYNSLINQSSAMYLSSSSAYSADNARIAHFSVSFASPNNHDYKRGGFAVRCSL